MRQPTNDFNNRERVPEPQVSYRTQEDVDAVWHDAYYEMRQKSLMKTINELFIKSVENDLSDSFRYAMGGFGLLGDKLMPDFRPYVFDPVYPRITIDRLPTRSGKTAAMLKSFRDEMARYPYTPERREEVIRDLDRSSPVTGAMLEKAKSDIRDFRPHPEPALIFYDEGPTVLPPGAVDVLYHGRENRPPAKRLFRVHPDGTIETFYQVDKIDFQRSW